MKTSMNELLLTIPLYDLTFITPFPKKEVIYEQVVTTITNEWFDKPTLLLLKSDVEIRKLNVKEVANQLIQDSHILAIIVCKKGRFSLKDETFSLYEALQIPIIHLTGVDHASIFFQQENKIQRYSQLSVEINGFANKGFMHIASNISFAFQTPMIFLDDNKQLLWQTGDEKELTKAQQWINRFVNHEESLLRNKNNPHSNINCDFEYYTMNIAGKLNIYVIVASHLARWQKELIDKFIGLTAVVFQTDELVREQNERLKELFVYELLYRKFESKKLLVKQGKTWGWNLEKPHHLLIIHMDEVPHSDLNIDWLEEMVYFLETGKKERQERIIVFPFQDQVIVFVEDDEERTPNERIKVIMEIANWIVTRLSEEFPALNVQLGIGKWYDDTIYLNKSYQEAKMALRFGSTWFENRQIFHINHIGVHHLLTHVHREILYDFCKEYLSQLIKSDTENDTEYLNTLKKYIQNQGIINDVAKALYIHPNTLRNRIKKIEEITGIELQNLDEFMNLMVAVKVYYSFFHKKTEE